MRGVAHIACWSACAALSVVAAPQPIAPSIPAPPPERTWIEWIDDQQAFISRHVVNTGRGMDNWLAEAFREDPPPAGRLPLDLPMREDFADEELQRASRLTLSPYVEWVDGEGVQLKPRIRLRLHLPRLQRRVALVFDNADETQSVIGDLDRSVKTGTRSDPAGQASVRYYLRDLLDFRVSVDAGLSFHPEPDPRITLRLKKQRDYERFTATLTQRIVWERGEGWGERTTLEFDQHRYRCHLRRVGLTALFSETSQGVEFGPSAAWLHCLDTRRMVGLRGAISLYTRPEFGAENYVVRAVYRQRLHRDWLYFQLESGFDFPEERDYTATPVVRATLDISFGLPHELPTGLP